MIDLKLSDDEKSNMMGGGGEMSYPVVPDYPYGMCLYFDEATLEKLKQQPLTPGALVSFSAEACVVSMEVDSDGKPCCLRLQICGMDPLVVEQDAAKVMYG